MGILDQFRGGTFHMDRVAHIENVCIALGFLSHALPSGRIDNDVMFNGTAHKTPRFTGYGFRVNARAHDKFKAAAECFATELEIDAVRIERVGGTFFVQIPHDDPEIVTYADVLAIDRTPLLPGEVLLGMAQDGQQMTLNLSAPEITHAIVVGMTGSGKSTLMSGMIMSGESNGTKVALFDPTTDADKNLRPLSGHPNVWRGGMFHSLDECARGLEILAGGKGHRVSDGPLLVFVDDVPKLVANRPAIRGYLGELAQAGRHDGIHLILGAQHALISTLSSEVLRNMPVSIVGRVRDAQASYNATSIREARAEKLEGNGDFLLVSAGETQRFQAPLVTAADLARFRSTYPPRPPRLPPVCVRLDPKARAALLASRGQGRPTEDPDAAVVEAIRAYIDQYGEPPSSNWIYRVSRDVLGAGYGRDKAQRAIDDAQGGGEK